MEEVPEPQAEIDEDCDSLENAKAARLVTSAIKVYITNLDNPSERSDKARQIHNHIHMYTIHVSPGHVAHFALRDVELVDIFFTPTITRHVADICTEMG